MKTKKMLAAYFIMFIILTGMSACGSKPAGTPERQASSQQASFQQSTAEETTDQPAAIEASVPAANPTASDDSLIGSWVDINSADCFVKITKEGTEYQYDDSDGKYKATFKNGVLKVKVSDSDTADVFIDAGTGHMLTVYQGGVRNM